MPDGFEVSLYAVVPDARSMAVAPQGTVMFVGTRKDKVWSVVDRNRDRVADEVKDFAPSLTFDIPNGPCFSPDGFLYIAERNRVLMFPAAEFFFEGPDVAVGDGRAAGRADPGRGGELQPHRAGLRHRAGRQALHLARPAAQRAAGRQGRAVRRDRHRRHHPDEPRWHGREVFTRGVRNSVGQDFNPANGELWWTDNQVDGMGDDIPPGELNRQTAAGQHFGFPWTNAQVEIPAFKDVPRPENVSFIEPQVEMQAHAADLGMIFYTGDCSRRSIRAASSRRSTGRGTARSRSARG